MDQKLTSLTSVVERTDARLRSPEAEVRIWPTGFPILDESIGGGFRAGALNVLAGPQGQGKSTMALQMCRNAAAAGCSAVMFSFELEAEVLLQRLISHGGRADVRHQRAADLPDPRGLRRSRPRRADCRSAWRECAGPMAIEALMSIGRYSDRLVIHRSTTAHDRHAVDLRLRQGGVRRHGPAAADRRRLPPEGEAVRPDACPRSSRSP